MAETTVEMTYAPIQAVSKGFQTMAQTLKTIGKALEIAIQILRASAFASMGTSLAMANYLDVIKQKVEKLGKLCTEFSNDLKRAVDDHKKGDYRAGSYFGEGVA